MRSALERHTDRLDISSIGHGARPIEELIATLTDAGIQTVADVRRAPGSRRHPQFGAKALEASLSELGIAYVHLPGLGGRREPRDDSPRRAIRVAAFRGYADHMASDEFVREHERLTTWARGARTGFMGAETLWGRGHRPATAGPAPAGGRAR